MSELWIKIWKLIKPYQKQVIILSVLIIVEEIVTIFGTYILKYVIDAISSFRPENLKNAILLIAAMFLVNEFDSFLGIANDKRRFKILVGLENYLPIEAHKKMVNLSLGYHEKEHSGSKASKIQRGVDKLVGLLGDASWQVLPTLFQLVITAVMLLLFNWRFALMFIILVPIFIFVTFKLNRKNYPLRKKRHDDYERADGLLAQAITNINTVKSFVQEQREINTFSGIREHIKENELKEWFRTMNYNFIRNFIIDAGRIFMLLFGVYAVWNKMLSIGSLVFIITINEKALLSLYRISRIYDRIMDSSEAVARLSDLLKEEDNVKNPKNGLVPNALKGALEFVDVDFYYGDSHKKVLDDVSLKIVPGCVTAFAGPSGGGKSTLVKLIYRHYDPNQGTILLDGKDLRTYDIHSFRSFMAIVPQEVEIFNASIRENISYADPEASMEEVEAAARTANAHEFIEQMKEGYKTKVGERGVKLSGGQRQRIGIARAVLANPRILIFDEATSNLDSYSEKLIQDAMEKIKKDKTLIIIAHRLSTIRKADKIIVLENGKVVEAGNHYELAGNRGGLYAKLLKLQEIGEVGQ